MERKSSVTPQSPYNNNPLESRVRESTSTWSYEVLYKELKWFQGVSEVKIHVQSTPDACTAWRAIRSMLFERDKVLS